MMMLLMLEVVLAARRLDAFICDNWRWRRRKSDFLTVVRRQRGTISVRAPAVRYQLTWYNLVDS